MTDGREASKAISTRSPAAAILDVGLPSMAGTEVYCGAAIRSELDAHPLCTARGGEIDRVLGLELGADDYITKPFGPREVAARVKAVLRRSEARESVTGDVLSMGGIEVDTNARRATVGEAELN